MKEHIKKFPTIASADGHIIDAPFISAIHQEQGDPILVRCKEDGKKLKVEGGQISVVDAVTTSSFYVNGIEYTYEVGMTWERWIASTYNTDGFTTQGYTVTTSVGYVIRTNGVSTIYYDLIDGTSTYTFDTNEQPK